MRKNFSQMSLSKHLLSANVNLKMDLRVLFAHLTFPSNLTFTKTESYSKVAAVLHATSVCVGIEL